MVNRTIRGKASWTTWNHEAESVESAAWTMREETRKKIADIIICAVRMAETYPGGPMDVERLVFDRLQDKFPPRIEPQET